ncbi:MAG: HAD family hydrolase [Candidatus Nanohaloarchaeota archaeon QJJ-9]|nr:HAD family hydrolase [Candidatus Nanohaloarchaeota archaeon QJJ-9]
MGYAIFFNLDGTLTEDSLDYEEVYKKAVVKAGLEDLKGEYKSYTDLFFRYFQQDYIFPRRQAIDKLSKQKNCYSGEKVEKFAEEWERLEAEGTEAKAEAEELLEKLRGKYSVGIITNGNESLQRKKLKNTGLDQYVDHIYISSEEGRMNNFPGLFEKVEEKVGGEKHIMVSHRPQLDILMAKKAGFTPIWISDTEKEIPEEVAYKIESLEEVPEAIEKICGEG